MPSGYSNKTGLPINSGKKLPKLSEKYKGKGNPMYGKHAWNYKRNMNDYPQMGFQKGHKCLNHMIGENHYRWIKDRDLINIKERNNSEYRQWRYQIFKRDRHICKINNKDCKGKVIAHHILSWKDHPELRYNINNGITLCQAHHPLRRAEEKRLIPFFMDLVPVSK